MLWIDDYPENNVNERTMFRRLNLIIDTATSTHEALILAQKEKYDVVLSDMVRGAQADAGLDFLQKLRSTDKTTPMIFYIGTIDPTKGVPAQSFGLTNRPDELLHLTIDALERKKA